MRMIVSAAKQKLKLVIVCDGLKVAKKNLWNFVILYESDTHRHSQLLEN